MIIDCFIFNDELDILEMRLETYNPHVDFFVICEGPTTFQGTRKPYHLVDNLYRFKKYVHKLLIIHADEPGQHGLGFPTEFRQRRALIEGLNAIVLDPADIIMLSDVDEILRPSTLQLLVDRDIFLPTTVALRQHLFAVDYLYPYTDKNNVICTREYLRLAYQDDMQRMRDARLELPALDDTHGWHFSWLGGHRATIDKTLAFSHPDYLPRVEAVDSYTVGTSFDGVALDPVRVTPEDWPAYIAEHRAPASWYRPRM